MKTMEGLETELYLAHERIKQLESKLFYSVPLSEVNEFCKNELAALVEELTIQSKGKRDAITRSIETIKPS